MATLTKYTTPQVEIGEYVNVLAGLANNNAVVSNSQGKFILTGAVYNKADYPELFNRIGYLGATNFTPVNIGAATRAIAYGNGLFLQGGAAGAIRTSTNGTSWTLRTSGTTSSINKLVYGNGLYVYVAEGGGLGTSTNGTAWTARTSGTTTSILALTYGNGVYVYAGNGGALASSTDAITWTARTSGTTSTIQILEYRNGLYIYGGTSSTLATSTDAITWTPCTNLPITNGDPSYYTGVVYGNDKYVIASGYFGYKDTFGIYTTTDFVSYERNQQLLNAFSIYNEAVNSNLQRNWFYFLTSIIYNNGTYVVFPQTVFGSGPNDVAGETGTPSMVLTSTDLQNWIGIPSNARDVGILQGLVYGNGLYVHAHSLFGTSANTLLVSSNLTGVPQNSPFYNASTQFYVPSVNAGSTALTFTTTTGFSSPIIRTYVRAK